MIRRYYFFRIFYKKVTEGSTNYYVDEGIIEHRSFLSKITKVFDEIIKQGKKRSENQPLSVQDFRRVK